MCLHLLFHAEGWMSDLQQIKGVDATIETIDNRRQIWGAPVMACIVGFSDAHKSM